jgi:hypothetical protein
MGWQRCFLLAVVIFLATRVSYAGVLPIATASLTVDGISYPLPVVPVVEEGKTYQVIPNVTIGDEALGFRAMISGAADPDPAISYGLGITDFGAPSTFTFIFTSPIVPTGPPSISNAYVSGGLNNVSGAGVTITPILPDSDGDGAAEVQVASVSSGGPFVNMGVDVGPLQANSGPIGALYAYPPAPASLHSAGPLGGPAGGPWTSLSVTAAFSLTGGGDSAALTGLASIVIPEPSTWLLMAVGVVFAWFRIRRPGTQSNHQWI